MSRKIIPLWLFALLLLSGCGSSLQVYSDMDQSGSFDQYATYSFLDYTEGNKKTINGMELERIRVAFARELEQQGLTFSEEKADIAVQLTVYHREAVDGYYGYSRVYHFLERAITVDLYDNGNMKHVWHCAAVDQLEMDPEERADQLPGIVAEMFAQYPVTVASAK
jgi:hypothetical protein